jgi:hypothetical protein
VPRMPSCSSRSSALASELLEDPLPRLVVDHQLAHAVALGRGVLRVAAHVEVEASAVGQEDVAAASPRHDPSEQVAGDLVGAQPSLAARGAGDAVLVLDPEDPTLHGLTVPATVHPGGSGDAVLLEGGLLGQLGVLLAEAGEPLASGPERLLVARHDLLTVDLEARAEGSSAAMALAGGLGAPATLGEEVDELVHQGPDRPRCSGTLPASTRSTIIGCVRLQPSKKVTRVRCWAG